MSELWYYIYGITGAEAAPLPTLSGIGGEAVFALPAGDLQVIASCADELGPDPSEENTLAHHQVLADLMAGRTVIPFAFGHLLPERLLQRLAATAGADCRRLLHELAGKIEVGLKLFWTREQFLPDIETPEVTAAIAAAAGAPGMAATVGELVQAAADRKRAGYVRQVYEPLAARAAAARLSDVSGPRMILNAAFLIDRAAEAEFDAAVGQVCAPLQGKLDIRYTGPWPPYSFSTLRLHLAEEDGA